MFESCNGNNGCCLLMMSMVCWFWVVVYWSLVLGFEEVDIVRSWPVVVGWLVVVDLNFLVFRFPPEMGICYAEDSRQCQYNGHEQTSLEEKVDSIS